MDLEALWRGFCEPPDEARPRAWWHWMDGNVDPEGIRLDLEWLHRVGVRGVQMFDGGMGTPLVVPERVRHGSPEWREAVRHAASTAAPARPRVHGRHLGRVERGRWAVGRARRRDEEGRVVRDPRRGRPDGRGSRSRRCPTSPARTRTARDGAPIPAAHRYAQDWVAVAVPAEQVAGRPGPCARRGVRSARTTGPAWSTAPSRASVSLPRDPDGPSSAWIEQVFDEPVTVGAVTVGLPGPRGFGAAPPPSARARGQRRRGHLPRRRRAARGRRPGGQGRPGPHRGLRAGPGAPLPAHALRDQRRRRAAAARAGRAAAACAAPGVRVPGLGVRALRRAAASTRPR